MNTNETFDVVVVGAGIAGLCAANRAAQQGLKVAVLERGADERYLCNSRYSGGVLHIACHNAKDPAEKLLAVIQDATSGKADAQLARALATTAGRAIDWLRDEGAKYIRVGNIVWQQHVLAPPRPIAAGLDWKGRGPDVTGLWSDRCNLHRVMFATQILEMLQAITLAALAVAGILAPWHMITLAMRLSAPNASPAARARAVAVIR